MWGTSLITIFVHRNGHTEEVTSIDRSWLRPSSGAMLWVDLAAPSIPESLILSDTFAFHPLAVEDAMSRRQYPKVEPYDGFLYLILHGLAFQESEEEQEARFATHDIDFFLGPNYLVTVHDGTSRSIKEVRDQCPRNNLFLGDGPVGLCHRIVDRLVERYTPEVEKLADALDVVEDLVFTDPEPELMRRILRYKRDVSALRRIVMPQRDVIGRLARREFVDISTEMAFRFRDVYDQLVRIGDEATLFQDRITGILDAQLSTTSNRLNQVMKLLTVMATVFMPLTVLTGLYGMNVPLPHLPGGEAAQFWWLSGAMALVIIAMLAAFRRMRWI